jgi:hypothetical protein
MATPTNARRRWRSGSRSSAARSSTIDGKRSSRLARSPLETIFRSHALGRAGGGASSRRPASTASVRTASDDAGNGRAPCSAS